MTTWFTSDLHLHHKNIITYCKRPFKSVEEMNATIIDNLLHNVKLGDTLYILGDVVFHDSGVENFLTMLKRMGITIIIIFGNHDHSFTRKLCKKLDIETHYLLHTKIEEQEITMCHFPMREWHNSHFNSWQLHGHSHGLCTPIGKQLDVGVDVHDFKPISFEQVKEYMDKQDNNENYLTKDERN